MRRFFHRRIRSGRWRPSGSETVCCCLGVPVGSLAPAGNISERKAAAAAEPRQNKKKEKRGDRLYSARRETTTSSGRHGPTIYSVSSQEACSRVVCVIKCGKRRNRVPRFSLSTRITQSACENSLLSLSLSLHGLKLFLLFCCCLCGVLHIGWNGSIIKSPWK